MTKYTFLILIATSFLLGCHQTKTNDKEKPAENKTELKSDTTSKGVTLSVEPNVFARSTPPNTVEVKITNNTNDTIITGLHYRIEIFENNKWEEISPKDIAFVDIGFKLKPFDYRYFDKQLLKDRINYEKGRYRIVKNYIKPDYSKTKESYDVYAEFNIE